ncbi:Leucine-rich repeat-containing protein [Trichinella spiralis]|uniref:Leucine-rich repeat-containing protein n=1 Tax=Trichinella spiralis TaxID=6334 RepID=A0ABR3KML9_TRISP
MLTPIAAETFAGVFPHFHLVMMHESLYNVGIQCCSVQDHHEQQDIGELSCCILSGILPNHLVDNVYSVFGLIVMTDDLRYFSGGCDLISSAT